MSEIRLICPGCDAEYRLPPDAIPPAGREVECSACGRVWMAFAPAAGPRLDLSGFAAPEAADSATPPPPPLPPPSKRLPPNVLSILREEVEHERRLRAAEAAKRPGTVSPDTTGTEADWPATTVTLPAGTARAMIAAPQPQPPRLDLAADPALLQPPQANPLATENIEQITPASAEAQTPQVIRHTPPPVSPRMIGRAAGYHTGFGLAVMVAACCVALYLLAPGLADNGNSFGQHLMELRHEVDRGRMWLQDHARSVTSALSG